MKTQICKYFHTCFAYKSFICASNKPTKSKLNNVHHNFLSTHMEFYTEMFKHLLLYDAPSTPVPTYVYVYTKSTPLLCLLFPVPGHVYITLKFGKVLPYIFKYMRVRAT